MAFGRFYRRAASDLNQAQTFVSGEATVRFLNDLVARAYLAIYGKDPVRPWAAVVWLVRSYPAVYRRNMRQVGLATLLCVVGVAFGYLASRFDPATARAHLLPSEMSMIQPRGEGEEDPTPLQTTGEFAAFSSFLFTHNLQVSLVAFALGITLGVGTVWLMFSNGVLLGASGRCSSRRGNSVRSRPACCRTAYWSCRPSSSRAGRVCSWRRGSFAPGRGPGATNWPASARRRCCSWPAACRCCRPPRSSKPTSRRAPDWFIGAGVKLGVASVVGLLFAAYVCLGGWPGLRFARRETPQGSAP